MDDLNQTTEQETDHQAPSEQPALSATERLRAFEHKLFGKNEPRINGQVQKGHGSAHRALPDDAKAHHAALELAIEAEKNLADARAKLTEAESAVATAEARVTATHDAHAEAESQRLEETAGADE